MLPKLLYILVLIAYVNTVFYQEGHMHGTNTSQVIDGAPLVEILLEDVLDIPHHESSNPVTDIQYDDYRPSTAQWVLALPLIRVIELYIIPVIDLEVRRTYVDFNTGISCLLGYYTYLFRLKPF